MKGFNDRLGRIPLKKSGRSRWAPARAADRGSTGDMFLSRELIENQKEPNLLFPLPDSIDGLGHDEFLNGNRRKAAVPESGRKEKVRFSESRGGPLPPPFGGNCLQILDEDDAEAPHRMVGEGVADTWH